MPFVVAVFGGAILFLALIDDPTPADKPLQYVAIGVGTVLVLAGLFTHCRWDRGRK